VQDPGSASRTGRWLEESQNDVLRLRYKIRRTLFSGRSEFQRVEIVECEG